MMEAVPHSSMEFDAEGWCLQAAHLPSPNCDARPEDTDASLLVVHNISLPPGQFGGPYVADLFLNRLDCSLHPYFEQLLDLRVSAHFFIDRAGSLTQFVSIRHRAWHAGVSLHCGRQRCNDFSIGVELEGTDEQPFTPSQYDVLCRLTMSLQKSCRLTHVAGHEHIAPGRKTDPGPFFDWPLYEAMLGEANASVASPEVALLFPVTDRPA